MKAGLGDIMKQAHEMQKNLKRVQNEIARAEVSGESGAGLVRIVMTGKHDVKKVEIDPSLIGNDKEMLQDLIAAAVNDANRHIDNMSKEKMSELSSGLNLAAGINLPF